MKRNKVEGILLDLDGTLIDSNDAHARAWQDALSEAGYQVDYQSVRELIGMGGDNLLPALVKINKDSEEGQRIDHRRGEIFQSFYLPKLKAFPAAQQLLEELKEQGLKLVIATSASKEDLKALLKQGNLENFVDDKTSSADAEHSKPDPDIVQAALEKAGLRPSEALMLGDTPYDLEAAKKAGVRSIAFTCGGWSREDLGLADFIFEGPKDMLLAIRENPGMMKFE